MFVATPPIITDLSDWATDAYRTDYIATAISYEHFTISLELPKAKDRFLLYVYLYARPIHQIAADYFAGADNTVRIFNHHLLDLTNRPARVQDFVDFYIEQINNSNEYVLAKVKAGISELSSRF